MSVVHHLGLWQMAKACVFADEAAFPCKCFQIMQEATELAPTDFDYLARCSKAWSDATYLDEITGKFKEKLTDQAKRGFNEKALGYSKKVTPQHSPGFSHL